MNKIKSLILALFTLTFAMSINADVKRVTYGKDTFYLISLYQPTPNSPCTVDEYTWNPTLSYYYKQFIIWTDLTETIIDTSTTPFALPINNCTFNKQFSDGHFVNFLSLTTYFFKNTFNYSTNITVVTSGSALNINGEPQGTFTVTNYITLPANSYINGWMASGNFTNATVTVSFPIVPAEPPEEE